MKTRDNQRGGIAIFAIIGLLLVSALAGALYVGKHQAELAKNDAPAPIAIDTEKEATEANKGTAAPTKDAAKDEAANKPTAPSANAPGPSSTTRPSGATTPAVAGVSAVTTVATSGPSEPLPATGLSDTLLSSGIIAAISLAVGIFLQSSARLRRSALSR